MEAMNVRFIGIDLGKRTMEVRIIEDDKVKSWHGYTRPSARNKFYKLLQAGDVIALEACSLAFVMAHEIEERTKAKVIVLNPRKLSVIYQSLKKTDSEDAMKLARLIMRIPKDELPVVPPPSEKEREMRALTHEMAFITQQRVRYVNRLHSLFVAQGITTITKADLKRRSSRNETVKMLSDRRLEEAKRLTQIIDLLEEQLGVLDDEENETLKSNELTPHVMSVPGVGPNTALAFLSFVGDGSRFSRAAEVSNYIGLVPRVDISGDTVRYGHINKKYGCTAIRRVLIQSAYALVRSKCGGPLAVKYMELKTRIGGKKAIVAIARRMGELLWALVRRRTYYRDMLPEIMTKKLKYYRLENFSEKGRLTA